MSKNNDHANWNFIKRLITGRRSTRAFLPKDVPVRDILEVLDAAKRAPSGGNLQPWKVHVVQDEVKQKLEKALVEAFFDKNTPPNDQYEYYPKKWVEPFASRRREVGVQLYKALNIAKRDINAMKAQKAENFRFFGAPVGLFFTIPDGLEKGSWLDTGLYIANVITLARARDWDTCLQASFISYHTVIRRILDIPDNEILICGMALGFSDQKHPVNSFRTERQDLKEFVTVHSYFSDQEPEDLLSRIEKHTLEKPAKNAFVLDGLGVSWHDFSLMIDQAYLGIKTADPAGFRVGLQLPNSIDFLSFFLGGVKAGRNIQVFDPTWPEKLTSDVISRVRPDHMVDVTAIPLQTNKISVGEPKVADIDIPFYTGFTSGSTGQPKGFVRNQKSWLLSFQCDDEEFHLTDADVICALGQFTHSLPLYAVIRALYEGATAVFYSNFRPDRILKDIENQHVSVLYAVPTQLQALYAAAGEQYRNSSVRLILSSGAKCSSEIRVNLKKIFPKALFCEFYGSSELSYVSVAKEEENPPPESVGRPMTGVIVEIVDDTGATLPRGEDGRILVKSPFEFIGYAGEEGGPQSQSDPMERNGLLVGDTGYLDEAGFLFLTGRADRMILSAARNIHPEEIETKLLKHDSIKNIAVLGVEDKKRGQRVVALVQLEAGEISKAELSRYSRKVMAPYVVPSQFYIVKSWPLTASGKTDFIALEGLLLKGNLDLLP